MTDYIQFSCLCCGKTLHQMVLMAGIVGQVLLSIIFSVMEFISGIVKIIIQNLAIALYWIIQLTEFLSIWWKILWNYGIKYLSTATIAESRSFVLFSLEYHRSNHQNNETKRFPRHVGAALKVNWKDVYDAQRVNPSMFKGHSMHAAGFSVDFISQRGINFLSFGDRMIKNTRDARVAFQLHSIVIQECFYQFFPGEKKPLLIFTENDTLSICTAYFHWIRGKINIVCIPKYMNFSW